MFRLASRVLLASLALSVSGCGDGRDRLVLQNKGSDTLVNVAQAWAEEYQNVRPDIVVAVSGGGSGTGIAALINGTVDLANSSRSMKDREVKQARDAGHEPIQHVVGYDALAIFLHPKNPIDEISIDQLAEIFGEGGAYIRWTDMGIEVPGCQKQEIVLVSRQNNSGTYAYFRESILGKGRDFRLGSRDMHGSKDVVDLVEHTPCAIGYSGLAYATDHIKLPCLSVHDNEPCVRPNKQTAADLTYPIARPLIMYTSGEPVGETAEYLDWIKSDAGQCIMSEKGYAPYRPVQCE